MGKFSGFLTGRPPAATLTTTTGTETGTARQKPGLDSDVLHGLLRDLNHKISGLDGIKELVGRLFDPVTSVLDALEAEKGEKLTLQAELSSNRSAYDDLRKKMSALENRASAVERDYLQVRQDLVAAKNDARALEAEVVTRGAQITDLEGKLSKENTQSKSLRDEIRFLRQRLGDADCRVAELTATIHRSRRRADLLEDEKQSLQSALGRATADVSSLSIRLVEAERGLANEQNLNPQTNHAEAQADQLLVSPAIEELVRRHNIKVVN